MIRGLLTILLVIALASAAAYAQRNMNFPMLPYANPTGPELPGGFSGPMIPGNAGSGGFPSVCSNSLDLSDACNSQYLGMMRF